MRHRSSDYCAPMSREKKYPKPIKILSPSKLNIAWHQSRDSTKKSAAPGTDRMRALTFAANLQSNIKSLSSQLKTQYSFSTLRPFLVPKSGGKKDRVICIPTVKDRLVQRTIGNYIHNSRKLPIYNSSSFGFLPDTGTKCALNEVMKLRRAFDYVFETDITSFFDTVDRKYLRQRIERVLGKHSIVPLLLAIANSEIKYDRKCNQSFLESLGIRPGVGIRQGMPLSPTLANLVLSEFDAAIERKNIKMVRYADDVVVFANSETDALEAGEFIKEKLVSIGHSIPDLEQGGKTQLVRKFEPLEFLGREIIFSDKEGDFVQRVSTSKIKKMKEKIIELSDVDQAVKDNLSFPEVAQKISRKTASFLHSYSDVYNALHLEHELRGARNHAQMKMIETVFGKNAISNISPKHRSFMGLIGEDLQMGDLEFEFF